LVLDKSKKTTLLAKDKVTHCYFVTYIIMLRVSFTLTQSSSSKWWSELQPQYNDKQEKERQKN